MLGSISTREAVRRLIVVEPPQPIVVRWFESSLSLKGFQALMYA